MYGSQKLFFLITFAHLFNNACHGNTVFCFFAFRKKKGSTCFVREEHWKTVQRLCVAALPLPAVGVVACFEGTSDVLWSSQSPVVNVWVYILHIRRYDNVYIVSYVIHTVTSSTRCPWQLGCKCEYVHIFCDFWFTHPPPSLKVNPHSVHAMTVPCNTCNTCTSCKSHCVLLPPCPRGPIGAFFLMTLGAVAKMCEL